MGINRSKPYKYGADADGNRYEWRTDVEIISDISGDEIEAGEVYDYDGDLCTLDELKDLVDVTQKTADQGLKCEYCHDPILKGEEYFEVDGAAYHEDCLNDWLYDNYHIDDEDAIEKYEYTYDDYLEDLGDRLYHEMKDMED